MNVAVKIRKADCVDAGVSHRCCVYCPMERTYVYSYHDVLIISMIQVTTPCNTKNDVPALNSLVLESFESQRSMSNSVLRAFQR